MDTDDNYLADTEDHLHPIWLSLSRDFEDRRAGEAQTCNQLLTQHLHCSVGAWNCDDGGWTFQLPYMTIRVHHDESGPLAAAAESDVMPRSTFGLACTLLRTIEEAAAWQGLWYNRLTQPRGRRAGQGATIRPPREFEERQRRARVGTLGFDARNIRGYGSVLDSHFGVNLRSVDDTAATLLGRPIEDVCRSIDQDFRILHVEPVFRDDLVSAFRTRQEQISDHLLGMSHDSLRQSVPSTVIRPNSSDDTKEGLARQLAMPKITFHGAPRGVIKSIVRYGFLVPGSKVGSTGTTLDVKCGSTYGTGIYSSPDASFASHYLDYQTGDIKLSRPSDVPGMRLIVCATLMGRSMQVAPFEARRVDGTLNPEAHSHVAKTGLEYIVFESSQIIPCYVLHLDYGADHAKAEYEKLRNNPTAYFQRRSKKNKSESNDEWEEWYKLCPGEIQDKKVALKASARKYLPYGFGPARGTSFVVEDMAENSDDEELYGDFQYQRIEQENEIQEARSTKKGASWFDEYQLVRKSDDELDFGTRDFI